MARPLGDAVSTLSDSERSSATAFSRVTSSLGPVMSPARSARSPSSATALRRSCFASAGFMAASAFCASARVVSTSFAVGSFDGSLAIDVRRTASFVGFLAVTLMGGSFLRQRSKISRSVRMMTSCRRSRASVSRARSAASAAGCGPPRTRLRRRPFEIGAGRLEAPVGVREEPVVDADCTQKATEAHGRARRQVPRGEELRIGALGARELLLHVAEELRERVEHRVGHLDRLGRGLQDVEILDRERRAEAAAGLHLLLQHAAEGVDVGEAARDEAHERDAIDEREQRLARALEDLGEVAVRRHERALDLRRAS